MTFFAIEERVPFVTLGTIPVQRLHVLLRIPASVWLTCRTAFALPEPGREPEWVQRWISGGALHFELSNRDGFSSVAALAYRL